MNIKYAKERVRSFVKAYLTKDRYGDYDIPVESQRPVFLMGPPGIGKTAIMEQIAEELDIALVSYSMTHHTRQSAIGLPFIAEKEYGGKTYQVSEYTMSEIIASMYDVMEITGKNEGILFLDEINCISETLAPSMLQFLQYKTFGRHRVPDGWVVVTAGNPPEYNDSVRSFDLVTWDRLNRIDVEPDFKVWREYADKIGVHPLILSYLETKKDDFYSIETTVDGKEFVTARGWVDLSGMICILEKQSETVDESLIYQYVQNRRIAKSFAAYYELFHKYMSKNWIKGILNGENPDKVIENLQNARFDERIAILGLLIHAAENDIRALYERGIAERRAVESIRGIKDELSALKSSDGARLIDKLRDKMSEQLDIERAGRSMSRELLRISRTVMEILAKESQALADSPDELGAATVISETMKIEHDTLISDANDVKGTLKNLFEFVEKAFGTGNEMLILVTHMTENKACAEFIARYGCDEYFKFNKDLMFYERQYDISEQIDELDLGN